MLQGNQGVVGLAGAVLLPSMVSASSGVPAIERLQSCEPAIAVPAAREIVSRPDNDYAFQDISNLDRSLDRVLAWDAKTPNPFRDRNRTADHDRTIGQIDTGLRDMRVKMAAEKEDLEDQARLFEPEIAQMYAERARAQCGQNQRSVIPVEPTRVR